MTPPSAFTVYYYAIAICSILQSLSAYNIRDLRDVCGVPSDSSVIRSATCQTSLNAPDYPWQVSIVGRDGVHWCTGTLITDRHVLSSAHCFFHESCGSKCKILSVALYELHFGRSNRTDFINSKTKQRSRIPDEVDVVRSIADIFIPSDFVQRDPVLEGNDIAVILLEEPIKFRKEILPACLPDSKSKDIFEVGGVGYVAGFSHIRSGNEVPLTLQAYRMDIVPPSACVKNLFVFGYDSSDATDTICSKSTFRCSRSKESSICQGDAGGPLMSPFRDEDGVSQWVVGGVHAFGAKLCGKAKSNIPIYFTRVYEYLDFINQIVNIDQASTTPLTTPSVTTTTTLKINSRKPSLQKTASPPPSQFPLPGLGQASFKCTDSKEGYICKYLTNESDKKQFDKSLVCGNTVEGYSCIFKIPKSPQKQKKQRIPTPRRSFQPKFNARRGGRPLVTSSTTTTAAPTAPKPRTSQFNSRRAPKFIRPAQRPKIRIQGTYRLRTNSPS